MYDSLFLFFPYIYYSKRKIPNKWGFFQKIVIFYCPATSETECAESETPAGALHDFAAVLNAVQAALRLVLQVAVALFTELLNVAQAAFVAVLTVAVVVFAYAAARAVALAVYASCTACAWVATAASMAASRVATAVPTQAILLAVVIGAGTPVVLS